MANKPYWTPDEAKILDEVESSLSRAFSEARAKMEPLRAKLKGLEEGARCFRCDCPDYVRPGGHNHICRRDTCRHGFLSHDFF